MAEILDTEGTELGHGGHGEGEAEAAEVGDGDAGTDAGGMR